jgi:hypothetical protein
VIKKAIFSSIAIVLLSFTMHKYFVSITDAAYNPKSQTLEISIKFIGHDLEHSMETAGVPELFLGEEKESDKANDYLKKYIDGKFKVIADGKQMSFKFIGKEVNNDDFIYCYLESEKLDLPKKIEIKNSLLTEVFSEQVNTVYLKVGDNNLTYTFNKNKVSETHKITE